MYNLVGHLGQGPAELCISLREIYATFCPNLSENIKDEFIDEDWRLSIHQRKLPGSFSFLFKIITDGIENANI